MDQRTALIFGAPAATDADLIFGADYVPPRTDVVMQATLPLPSSDITFIPLTRLDVSAPLPALTVSTLILRPSTPLHVGVLALPGVACSAEVHYASHTQRPTVGRTSHHWQVTQPQDAGMTQRQQDAAATPAGWATFWQRASDLTHSIAHRLPPILVAAPLLRRTGQQQATRLHGTTGFAHEVATPIAQIRTGVFQNATRLRDATRFEHQDGDRSKRAGRLALWQNARPLTQRQGSDFQIASRRPVGWRGLYQEAMRPPPGISVWVIPEPPEPPRCYMPSGHLLFAALAPASAHLLFFCENHTDPPDGEPVVVPVRRVYFVINQFSLVRPDTGQSIPAPQFDARLTYDSWGWQFSGHARADYLPLLTDPDGPVALMAEINGTALSCMVTRISRDRRFGEAWLQFSGLGPAAELAAPYSPVMSWANTSPRTARQLLDDVLTLNGVSIGWDIDWHLQDWLVGAGSWTFQGTYADAVARIAAAGGGYVQSHDTANTLHILPRYPEPPWHWSSLTPDLELSDHICEQEGIEWMDRPDYNAVWVAGSDGNGRVDRIVRAGTAGDSVAPMVVDALACAPEATRQRGKAILSDTGRQAHLRLRLPVLAGYGILRPGQLIAYTDTSAPKRRLGLIRSVEVAVRGIDSIWQTIGVETHD